MVQKRMNIAAAIALAIFLWQNSPVAAGPNYGLQDSVRGSGGVLDGVDRAAAYVGTLAAGELSDGSGVTHTAFGLVAIVQLLQATGTHVAEAGKSGTDALSALVSGSSGASAQLFASALQTIQDGMNHLQQHVPATKTSLAALIGSHVPDRLTDGFNRLGRGLTSLQGCVTALRDAVGAATAEAGSDLAVPVAILRRHVTLPLVYNLVAAVNDIGAYLPVIRYTLNLSIEDALTADQFLTAYQGIVGSLASLLTLSLAPLDAAQAQLYDDVKLTVEDLEWNFQYLQDDIGGLGITGKPALGTLIDAMMDMFVTTVSGIPADVLTLAGTMDTYMSDVELLLAITDPDVVSIDESELISTLVHTLIDSGPYARYCFHKYRPLVATLIDGLLERTGLCVEREVWRLADLGYAAGSLLETIGFDIEDIGDLLLVCDAIADPTKESQCVATIGNSVKPLGAAFAGKYDLLYELIDAELGASRQRLKICVQLSERSYGDSYVPDLRSEIEACAAGGPNAP